jgi:hypothetical protein
MKLSIFKRRPGARSLRSRATWATALFVLFGLGMLVGLVGGASAAATSVGLGTADSFAVLAGAGITNTGPTTVTGDLGTFPTTSITGAASLTVNGTNHAGDLATQGAISAGKPWRPGSTTPPPRLDSPGRSRLTPAATRTPSSSSRRAPRSPQHRGVR